jgi:hypothetical protein
MLKLMYTMFKSGMSFSVRVVDRPETDVLVHDKDDGFLFRLNACHPVGTTWSDRTEKLRMYARSVAV